MMQNSSMIMSKIFFDNQWRKALVREERGVVVVETLMIGGYRKAFGTSVERRLEANGDDKIVRCEILKWKIFGRKIGGDFWWAAHRGAAYPGGGQGKGRDHFHHMPQIAIMLDFA
eukprot:scaffold18909_cov49-Cyclotella_meneghiniana.AAC.1